MTVTVGEAVFMARHALAQRGVSEAHLEAELLLAQVMSTDRAGLLAALTEPVPDGCQQTLDTLVSRRTLREPLAYIRGTREFYGLDLHVRPGVLIPRPETETLVEEALSIRQDPDERIVIADVGTGSGAIAVSLAVHLPHSRVYATDISDAALSTARINARRHGVDSRITLLNGDLLKPLPEPVDIVAANLPYLPTGGIDCLEPEVCWYEPREALDGGHDGLDLITRLLAEAPDYLRPNGAILLEMDPWQVESASRAARRAFPHASIRAVKDLAGDERVLVVES